MQLRFQLGQVWTSRNTNRNAEVFVVHDNGIKARLRYLDDGQLTDDWLDIGTAQASSAWIAQQDIVAH